MDQKDVIFLLLFCWSNPLAYTVCPWGGMGGDCEVNKKNNGIIPQINPNTIWQYLARLGKYNSYILLLKFTASKTGERLRIEFCGRFRCVRLKLEVLHFLEV